MAKKCTVKYVLVAKYKNNITRFVGSRNSKEIACFKDYEDALSWIYANGRTKTFVAEYVKDVFNKNAKIVSVEEWNTAEDHLQDFNTIKFRKIS